ncbi:BppU family phage baseplate upper protein [Enterococcus durans]|uniref:BppU family phage baseplate upper protein n=1 Tax=Enterococcus durans TaxID=53345 RepID=UPI003BEF1C60
MPIRKEKKIKVVPTTTGRREGGDNHLFYSYDDSSARFVFEFKNPDDTALDLLNATPQALLILHEESGDKKVVTEELGTISVIDGLVSFVIPDNVLGFRGKCDLYIALAFADGSSSDEVHVAFTIEESPFNKTYEEAADYYIKSFDVLLKEVELAKTNAINEIDEQLPQVQSRLENVENGLRVAEGELEELLDGMNLQVMYSNSIDFGDYDYSTAPNLMRTIKFSDLSTMNTPTGTVPTGVTDKGDYFEIDLTTMSVTESKLLWIPMTPRPQLGKQYTYSIELMCDEGEMNEVYIRPYFRNADGTSGVVFDSITKTVTSTWKRYSRLAGKASDNMVNSTLQSLQFYFPPAVTRRKLYVRYNIMVQEGDQTSSQALTWKPNLLDAPYYLSKVALGENIADPTVKFPITTSSEAIYAKNASEDFVLGETYTVTIGATKPASQTIRVYLAQKQFSDFKPVEGLVDTWVATVSITQLGENAKGVYLFQTPNTSLGSCTIKWLKIEKGDTRTPNIEQYKYRGIGMRDSNNPKDYVWNLAPEYVEDNLATDVKISEITGKANKYTDNAIAAVNTNVVNIADDLARQINSNKTAAESYADTKKTEAVNESKKYTDEAITNIKPYRTSLRIESGFSDGFTGWVTFERIGDIVIVSYALSPSTNTGTWKTPLPIASIPEEFHFNSNAYSTGSIATSNISNDVCQVGMNEQGLQFASWNRTAGIAQFAGQVTGAVKSREK